MKAQGWLVARAVGLLAICLGGRVAAEAPLFRWAAKAAGSGTDYGAVVALDSAGNTYAMGPFENGQINLGDRQLTNGNVFLAKYDAAGSLVWAKPLSIVGATGYCVGTVAYRAGCDTNGNLYVGGSFTGNPLHLDGTMLPPSAAPQWTFFLAKFDAAGNRVWSVTAAGSDDIRAEAFSVDAEGNTYLAGDYVSAPSLGLSAGPPGALGEYVAKFDRHGSNVWARTVAMVQNPNGKCFLTGLAVRADGSYAVCGGFTVEHLTLGPVTLTNRAPPSSDLYVAQFDAGGNLLMARAFGGVGNEFSTGLGADREGNVFVSGFNYGEPVVVGDAVFTNSQFFVVKFNLAGQLQWCRPSVRFSAGASGMMTRCAANDSGTSYAYGIFIGGGVMELGSLRVTNQNWEPVHFLGVYDGAGDFVWGKVFGKPNDDPGCDWVRPASKADLAVDGEGNCSLTGGFFRANPIFDGIDLGSVTLEDAFIARIEVEKSPRLEMAQSGNSAVVSWLATPTWELESTTNFTPGAVWLVVTNPVVAAGSRNFVTNSIEPTSRFFRLRKL